jgi:hypothetical protein
MSEIQEDDPFDAHGGFTQVGDDAEQPGCTQLPVSSYDIQDILKEEYANDPSSVNHVGILIEQQHQVEPHFFFTHSGITDIVLGSAYHSPCDIELKGKEKVGISNKAITFTFDSNRDCLSLCSSNKGPLLIRRRSNDDIQLIADRFCHSAPLSILVLSLLHVCI